MVPPAGRQELKRLQLDQVGEDHMTLHQASCILIGRER